MMADPQQRYATITGILSDYLPITNIAGDGQTFTNHFIQVKLQTIEIEPTEWEWPHFHYIYFALDDLFRDSPTLGDRIQADGTLSLTHFALNGHGKQTASAVKTFFQRIVLYVNNWSEVNLVNQQRRAFDALTTEFAASPWRFDEWLNAQTTLLPHNDDLATLQALMTATAKERGDLLIRTAPIAALMQNLSTIRLIHNDDSKYRSLTGLQLDEQVKLSRLHHHLIEQSARRSRDV